MFRYSNFDLITKSNKKTKYILKFIINVIIISFIIIIFLINIDTKDNVKIISSNSRRIINNLHNYTETMSNFIAYGSNNDNDMFHGYLYNLTFYTNNNPTYTFGIFKTKKESNKLFTLDPKKTWRSPFQYTIQNNLNPVI